jgi:CHAT domain-containing protein/Tfp pilus assembly protein PilF
MSHSRHLRIFQVVAFAIIFCSGASLRAISSGQAASAAASVPDQVEAPVIDAGKIIDRELAGGQKDTYRVAFAEGQYAKILVEQRGVDVVVRLLDADGKALIEADADPRKIGEEVVEFTSSGCQACRLTVDPRQKNAPAGHYEIHVPELRTATKKDFTLNEARLLTTKATQLWRQGKLDDALPLAERSLAIREKELGPEHPDVATSLFSLANIYSDKGDFPKAEEFYLHALDVRKKALGPEHVSVSAILNNLGILYKDRGDYAKAETFLQQALDIREKTLEPDHLLIASVLNNLAVIAHVKGDDTRAEALDTRVLEIREKAEGQEHPDVATALNNLANLYSDPQKSVPLYERALAIREKALGPDHPEVGQTLYNLAVTYSSAGQYAKAEEYCRRSQVILEKALGPEHPLTSYTWNLLAIIYKMTGNYAQSEALYLRSIAIKEKTQGKYHPDLAGALANLANLYAVKGDLDKAIATQARADEIFEYNIRLNLAAGSEEQKLAYLKTLADIEDQTIMLHVQSAPGYKSAAELAVDTILQRKGRVLDATANNFEMLRRRSSPQDQQLLNQLSDTTKHLAELVFDGPQNMSATEHEEKIRALEQQRQKLEREISTRSAGFYQDTTPVTVARIEAALPPRAALLEFAVYRPISPKAYEFISDRELDPTAVGEPRYVAYIIRAQGTIIGIDLGPKKEIDDAISACRLTLRDPESKSLASARAVDEKIMGRIRSQLGDVTQLLISPEGELNLIPFEALMDEQGHYLIEKYSISYLSAGRDLLRLQAAHPNDTPPIIVGDPNYGEPQAAPPDVVARRKVRPATVNYARRSVTTGDDLSTLYFAPLPATAQEARAIKGLFPEAKLLIGAQATKQELEMASAPRILHIATHGFFLQDPAAKAQAHGANPDLSTAQSTKAGSEIGSPLLRSGLALAGANLKRDGSQKGILTALEAANLNLWGTKLVTLSACDTGVGDVRDGEGVYGLRRAFVLAGSESVVMSLWPVSDYMTREMMSSYYTGLKEGLGRGEALRQTKLAMLKRKDRRHPFYWASFIQSGEWANLDGRRP